MRNIAYVTNSMFNRYPVIFTGGIVPTAWQLVLDLLRL